MGTWRNRGASGGLAGASSKFESRPQKRKPPPRRQLGTVCDRRSQLWPWLGFPRALARCLGRGDRLWRRKSSRTRPAQGVWHQWQRHADALRGKLAAGEDAPLVVTIVHGWVDGADAAGAAAAAMGVGTATSTASEANVGEP